MADQGGDFVVYPKEYENIRLNEAASTSNSIITSDSKESNTEFSNEAKPEEGKSILSTPMKPKVRRSGDERFYSMAKLALLLARNDAYNEQFQIKGRDGQFVQGSDVVKFFKFATLNHRKFQGIHDYIHQLGKLKLDLSNLIKNPIVMQYLHLELENNEHNQSNLTDDELTKEIPIDNSNAEIEFEIPGGIKEGNKKRKLVDPQYFQSDPMWSYVPPKKGKLIEDEQAVLDLANLEWDKYPDLEETGAQLFDGGLENVEK